MNLHENKRGLYNSGKVFDELAPLNWRIPDSDR